MGNEEEEEEATVSFVAEKIKRIRDNPYLRKREEEKDSFAFKWAWRRNGLFEGFLIAGLRRDKRQKQSAR